MWRVAGPPANLTLLNPHGAVRITVENRPDVSIQATSEEGTTQASDVAVVRNEDGIEAVVREAVDLEVLAPYRLLIKAATGAGDLSYSGYGWASFETETGAVSLTYPREATAFELISAEPPLFFSGEALLETDGESWRARDRLTAEAVGAAYGRLTLRAGRPGSVMLTAVPAIPEDSPVKPHWLAGRLLPRLFRRFGDPKFENQETPEADGPAESAADFSADVRLVQLDVSVTDKEGRAIAGLGVDDFEVLENGDPQRLVDVSSNEAPFNLVLLLDCSSSTEEDRPAIEQAARNFLGVARPDDRIAVYALAQTHFQTLSTLSSDLEAARAGIASISGFGGATPLRDAIVLAYAEELAGLPKQRNALVLLTDGLDNSIYGGGSDLLPGKLMGRRMWLGGVASDVPFHHLRKAAEEMRTLIYPLVLDPVRAISGTQPFLRERAQGWGREAMLQMQSLADATGGRVFPVRSLDDLDEVYGRVADELRSVYTLTYRPSDQNFDGDWRKVRVKASRRGLVVRTRAGYHAF